MNGVFKDLGLTFTGDNVLTITTKVDCRPLWEELGGQGVVFTVKKLRKRRSLNANNYAWALMEKLAEVLRTDKESVYLDMLRKYGAGETYQDDAGNECKVMFSLREDVPPGMVARHYEAIGDGYVDGKRFIHYRALKGSSEYNTREMSVFLDGVVAECRELGIQTDTPEQIARYKDLWQK